MTGPSPRPTGRQARVMKVTQDYPPPFQLTSGLRSQLQIEVEVILPGIWGLLDPKAHRQ